MSRTESAETNPLFRRGAKALVLGAWLAATAAAMAMTFDVMIAKAGSGAPPWLVLGLVTIGLACDLWVGAGPVLITNAARWRQWGWAWVGGAGLALALTITFTNKVDFWGSRADARQDTAALVERAQEVDPLAADRATIARAEAAGTLRPLVEVEAELIGVRREFEALNADAARFPTRLVGVRERLTALESEAARVRAVEDARARIIAAATATAAEAPLTSRTVEEHLARDRWIAGALTGLAAAQPRTFGGLAGVTPGLVEAWMNGLFAVFHELLCFVGLILATLSQPVWAIRREAAAAAQRKGARRTAELEAQLELTRVEARLKIERARGEAEAKAEQIRLERELKALQAQAAAADEADRQAELFDRWPGAPPSHPTPPPPEPQGEIDVEKPPPSPEPGFWGRLFGARDEGWRYFAREKIGPRWWEQPNVTPPSDEDLPRYSGRGLPAPDSHKSRGRKKRFTQAELDARAQREALQREIERLQEERAKLSAEVYPPRAEPLDVPFTEQLVNEGDQSVTPAAELSPPERRANG